MYDIHHMSPKYPVMAGLNGLGLRAESSGRANGTVQRCSRRAHGSASAERSASRSARGARLAWCVWVGLATSGVSCRPSKPLGASPDNVIERRDPSIETHRQLSILLNALKSTDVEIIDASNVGAGISIVTYIFDQTDSWEGGLRERGDLEAFEADLQDAEAACEAYTRGGVAGVEPMEELWAPINDMDDRSCHHRAMQALAPGGVAEQCLALEVARVRGDSVEPLWSSVGKCDVSLQSVYTEDVARAGWPQLVLVVSYSGYGVSRVGYGATIDVVELVVLDPWASEDSVMFNARLRWESTADEVWTSEGGYAHVVSDQAKKRLLVFNQTWRSDNECEMSVLGWASPKVPNNRDDDSFCQVEWTIDEFLWDPSRRRWATRRPIDAPLPNRVEELQVIGG